MEINKSNGKVIKAIIDSLAISYPFCIMISVKACSCN